MPRECVEIEDTWIFKTISFYNHMFYFVVFSRRAMTVKIALECALEASRYYKPDLVIFQFGVVDAVRRALPNYIRIPLQHIPLGQSFIRKTLQKNHRILTRLFNNHTTSRQEFERITFNISSHVLKEIKHVFIEIAQPGEYLAKQCYNAHEDINDYNLFFKKLEKSNCSVLKYPSDANFNEILLKEDGHHLNPLGHEMVFSLVKQYFSNIFQQK